jgi:hypothetical protein
MLLDELFAYTERHSSVLVRWNFDGPFLGQSVCLLVATLK